MYRFVVFFAIFLGFTFPSVFAYASTNGWDRHSSKLLSRDYIQEENEVYLEFSCFEGTSGRGIVRWHIGGALEGEYVDERERINYRFDGGEVFSMSLLDISTFIDNFIDEILASNSLSMYSKSTKTKAIFSLNHAADKLREFRENCLSPT
ncbi:MAG: hypothetical protein WDZ84_05015 [Rhodovibrionaceae bacterium]